MNHKTIIYEKHDAFGLIKLNRPEARNAIDLVLREELRELILSIKEDSSVRSVILTGAGDCFCAGGDVKTMGGSESTTDGRKRVLRINDTCRELAFLEKPVIAAINGPAVGGGLGLVLACDLVLASPQAKFAAPQVRLGLVPDMGVTYFLPRVVGLNKARQMILTGETIDAEEAYRVGLVTRLVPAGDLEDEAMKEAARLANASTTTLGLAKTNLLRGLEQDLVTVHMDEAHVQAILFQSPDHKEAFQAFLDHRRPEFKK